MLVISHPEAVLNIAVPMFEITLTLHMTVNAKWLNGPQRDGAVSLGVETIVTEQARRVATAASATGKRHRLGRHSERTGSPC
jgi:hypothetical protein